MKKIFCSLLTIAFTALAFTSCEDVPAPYEIPVSGDTESPIEGVYINESFATNFGDFTVNTVTGTPWVIDFSTAKASGYDNTTKVTTPSESYLISSAIDLSNSNGAYLEFEYILRYMTNYGIPDPTKIVKVLVSDAYTGDPTTTTWEDITGTLTEGSDWETFSKYSCDLGSQYIGKQDVRIALYYKCGDDSPTWEVKNLKVLEGTASGGSDSPVGGEGDGTEASPYNVTAAISKASGSGVFVKGYIVGYVSGISYDNGTVFSSDTCTVTTNLLIAATATEKNPANCMPVQIPAGVVRDALNLNQNKSNIGKEVVLYGNIENYFRVPGIKAVTYAKLGDNEIGTKPSQTAGEILNETFAAGQGKFKIIDINNGGMNYVWSHASSYSCMKVSAYFGGSNVAAESWLVSPVFSLAGVNDPILSFENAVNYLYDDNLSDHLELLVSTNYDGSGNVNNATWTPIAFAPLPMTNNGFTFVKSSASLKSYSGQQNVYIAFRYVSTTTCAPTWEVKNLSINDGQTGDNPSGEEISGDTFNADLNTFGFENQDDVNDIELSNGTVLTFSQEGGNNHPKFYSATKGVRMYALNSLTVKSAGKAIKAVRLQCDSYSGTNYVGNPQLYGEAGNQKVTPNVSGTTVTFSGFNSETIKIVNDWSSNSGGTQLRVKNVEIVYVD